MMETCVYTSVFGILEGFMLRQIVECLGPF